MRLRDYFRVPDVSYRVWKVWMRDRDVFMKTVKVNFLLPFLEPILYLLGMGFGLGLYVKEVDGMPYAAFIAPALVSISMMNASFFECTYSSFVRMYYQKTFDAIISTPLNLDEVILGEILWGSTKSLINTSLMLPALFALQLIKLPDSLLLIPFSLLVGLVFSAIAMCFTAISPTIDSFNYPTFLFITPMFLFSGTFFPLSALPDPIRLASQIFFPLTHAVLISRGLTAGRLDAQSLISLAWLISAGAVLTILSINLMRRRLLA
ncbi:MAG: ABC transporter permease [Candidatus Bathyarchaeia archaeon]